VTQALRLPRTNALRFPPGARCIAYVRVSTERQAGEAKVSPETQLTTCRRLASERGLAVEHVVEDHESGAHLARLDRLVAACTAHRLPPGQRGLICVYDTSRWGRFVDPGDDRMFRQLLKRLGWDVRIGNEPETEHEAANLFIATGQAIASSDYRTQLRQKVVDNMPRVAADGYWQGRAPFGFVVAPVEGGRHKLAKGSERDGQTVREIYARFAKGQTLKQIVAWLNDSNAPGPFDAYPSHTWHWENSGRKAPCGKWTSSAVRAILSNETYVGKIVFKPREVRDEKGKPVRFARNHVPEEHWVVVEDAHPALIERRTFEAARRRFADKRKPRRWSQSVEPFVLSGLITCAACKDLVVGGGGTRHGAKDPGATRHYRCRNGSGDSPTCTKPILTCNQRWLEGEVIGRVSEHVKMLVASGKLAALLDKRLGSKDGKPRLTSLGRELKELEQQRRTLVEKVSKGVLADEDAAETLATIKARLAHVGRELQSEQATPSRTDRTAEKARLLKLAADFPTLIKKVPAPVARELLSCWVEGIKLDKAKRRGEIKLREVPNSGSQVHRGAARRCSRGGYPPSSPRRAWTKHSRRRRSIRWPGCCRSASRSWRGGRSARRITPSRTQD
jgi:DNA invertase Pin-like site-specific DNA recombinase